MIPQSFIDDLISRIDIVEIIETRVPLKKQGSNYTACCPFHEEKTPSFSVSQNKQIYYCFGCKAGGNVIKFLMEYDRLNFPESVQLLANHIGIEIPRDAEAPTQKKPQKDLYQLMDAIAKFYFAQLQQHPEGKNAIEYFKNRGLTGQLAKDYLLGYSPDAWDTLEKQFTKKFTREDLVTTGMLIPKDQNRCYDRFRGRIMFPIRDRRGRVIAFGGRIINEGTPKYLNSPETPLFHKKQELYGLYEALQANKELSQVIIVEGYMDVIALAQKNITYAVATLGTATSSHHLKQLFRYTNRIIFAFDGDRAGKEAAWRALEVSFDVMQDDKDIRFLFLPENEDPDSMVRKEGQEVFESRMQNATSLHAYFFTELQKNIDISSSAGKATLIKRASHLLVKLTASAQKQLLIEQLSRIVRIDTSRIEQLLQQTQAESATATSMHAKHQKSLAMKSPSETTKRNPSELALALCLQQPAIFKEVKLPYHLFKTENTSLQLLKAIIEEIQQIPNIKTHILLEHFREHPQSNFLNTLANWQHAIPPAGIAAELQGALNLLAIQHDEHAIDKLMHKARQQTLSSDEKQQLQKLIISNKKLALELSK